MYGTKFYTKWAGLNARCRNMNSPKYPNYGGRGIQVCIRWHDFRNYMTDMYPSYQEAIKIYGEENTQIDRIDVNGDYCPENCRWVTNKQNCQNRRKRHLLQFNGVTLGVTQWAERLQVPDYILENRLYKYGWSVEKALTTPPRIIKKKNYPHPSCVQTLKAL